MFIYVFVMRKMTLVWFCFYLQVFSRAFGTGTIKGVIKDNKSKPWSGVSIAIKDSYDGGTSDSTGKYSFKTTEKGEQLLVISSIGYKMIEQTVKLEGGYAEHRCNT